MKQNLFKLMMTLAIVFGLSVSAWAQGSTADPGDTWTDFDGLYFDDPTFMLQNSIRGFQVAAHTGNSYSWTVYTVNIGSGDTTPATAGTDYSLWANADGTGTLVGSENAIFVKWLATSDANEVYALEVTETNNITGGCTSVRRFYVLVYGVDMEIVASDSNGDEVTSDLLTCNLWSGDVIGNHLTAVQLGKADGSYSNDNGTVIKQKYDTIYANVSMAGSLGDWVTNSTFTDTDAPGRILAASDVDQFRWRFNYAITTDGDGTTFVPTTDGSILSVTATNGESIYFDTEDTGDNFLGTDLNGTPTWTNELVTDDMTGSVYVAKGTTSFTLTIALHNIFNQSVSPSVSFEGSSLALERDDYDSGAGDDSFNDGGESDVTNNESEVQTRYASPATPVIIITD